VVPACGCDLERLAPEGLTADLSEVGRAWIRERSVGRRQLWPPPPSSKDLHEGLKAYSRPDGGPPDQTGFACARRRHDYVRLDHGGGQWEDARDPAKRSIEAKLADDGQAFQSARRELPVRNQDAECHCQIQA
jgi:hypothetical protein